MVVLVLAMGRFRNLFLKTQLINLLDSPSSSPSTEQKILIGTYEVQNQLKVSNLKSLYYICCDTSDYAHPSALAR